jgi:glycerol-3-phosphate acyltransferase PlsX
MPSTQRAPDILERPALRELVGLLDYSSYGGAPLLGVRGVSIICHGSSNPNAIKNGIRVALQAVSSGLNAHIGAEFAQREPAAS